MDKASAFCPNDPGSIPGLINLPICSYLNKNSLNVSSIIINNKVGPFQILYCTNNRSYNYINKFFFFLLAGPSQDVFLLPHIPQKGREVVYFLYINLWSYLSQPFMVLNGGSEVQSHSYLQPPLLDLKNRVTSKCKRKYYL